MYRWLILAAAGFILWKLFTGDKKRKKVNESERKEHMAAAGQMVKDPVCGAYVSLDSDIRVKEGEVVHRFCSYDCRDAYIAKVQGGTDQPKAVDSGEKQE